MRNDDLVSHDEILGLRSAVISAGLTESRRALLAGISADFVASLPDAAAPGAQVLTDLDALRTTGALAVRSHSMTRSPSMLGPRARTAPRRDGDGSAKSTRSSTSSAEAWARSISARRTGTAT
jgi:hypothetical protein